jgi:uncharacterized protein YqhQ
MEEKHRLGGMALSNGVLVHGPTSWACAVRTDDGAIKVAAERKSMTADVQSPFLRGPLKLFEAVAFLPRLKRALPEAKLPFERGSVIGGMIVSAAVVQGVRRSRLNGAAKELIGSLITIVPAVLSLREGSLAAYHGAEHIAIGSYEHGELRAKEHERCGSHLIGPMLLAAAAGNVIASRLPERSRPAARAFASVGAVAVSTELFSWMQRHPEHPAARALARPGHELQHRFATAEPTPEQLEVAEAALRACVELEDA